MKLNKSIILAGTALVGVFMTANAYAQSTATQETEVVIKGSKKGSGPLDKETGVKTKNVIGEQYIAKQSPGQTIADTLNVVPGYNFTNNDPYGSSGGNVRLRGLDGSRISLTFDGVQLNDAGNYAIYTNQQLDPELIAQASILTGGTDVDSMSASATGGTINYTTRKPSKDFGVTTTAAVGTYGFTRLFAMVDTGAFGPWGTTAFVSYSNQNYDTFTHEAVGGGDTGKLHKQQFNFSVYQPLYDGSFMSVSGNFNKNRNRFIFSQTQANYDKFGWDYNSATPGNINPSDTGNLRGKSKWVINDQLYITADPAYQYVMANGGGTSSLCEKTGKIGSWTNANFTNFDANGDGKINACTTADPAYFIFNPNTTMTNRFSLTSSAVYTFKDTNKLIFGISFDRGRTKQTGDGTLLMSDGYTPLSVFGFKTDSSLKILGKDGQPYERRYRFSLANVDVYSLKYLGHFFDDKLFVSVGVRSQKMERELHQYCYSKYDGTGGSAPFCTSQAPKATNSDGTVTFAGNTETVIIGGVSVTRDVAFIKPYQTTVSFSKVLPNLGLTYKIGDNGQIFANYSEALSSPKTDNYYSVVLTSTGTISPANPLPETNATSELGYRYTTSAITASATLWKSDYNNRIVSSYDITSDTYFDRNVGKVSMGGFEASFAYKFSDKFDIFSGFTYTDSEVKSDIANGTIKKNLGTDKIGDALFIPTAGKQLVETPKYMANLGMDWQIFPELSFNVTGKYVGKRFATDVNDFETKAYTTWNASFRYDLPKSGNYIQLNAINVLGERYYGSISTTTSALGITTASGSVNVAASAPSFNLGAPQTLILSLHSKF